MWGVCRARCLMVGLHTHTTRESGENKQTVNVIPEKVQLTLRFSPYGKRHNKLLLLIKTNEVKLQKHAGRHTPSRTHRMRPIIRCGWISGSGKCECMTEHRPRHSPKHRQMFDRDEERPVKWNNNSNGERKNYKKNLPNQQTPYHCRRYSLLSHSTIE